MSEAFRVCENVINRKVFRLRKVVGVDVANEFCECIERCAATGKNSVRPEKEMRCVATAGKKEMPCVAANYVNASIPKDFFLKFKERKNCHNMKYCF